MALDIHRTREEVCELITEYLLDISDVEFSMKEISDMSSKIFDLVNDT